VIDKGDPRDRPHEYGKAAERCGPTVLEAGCAFGAFAGYLPPTTTYVGVDLSELCVVRARVEHPERVFVRAAVEDLVAPLHDAFDTVCAFQLIEHYDDPLDIVRGLRLIARRRLILSVPRGPVQNHQRANDGHRYGWADEDELREYLQPVGDMAAFRGAAHHLCGVLTWT
jgi:SAM-dependent methyltransferase